MKQRITKEESVDELNGILELITENGELILKAKKIIVIPRAFYHNKFNSILVLDIRGNEITEIEGAICQNLPMIKKLDARNNKIKTISLHIKAMMRLTILRLDHNELTGLPNEICELAMLEELSFSDNKLSQLPSNIGQLT